MYVCASRFVSVSNRRVLVRHNASMPLPLRSSSPFSCFFILFPFIPDYSVLFVPFVPPSFPRFPLRSLRSLASPFVPPSFPLRSLASQVPAGCVGGGSRCPLSSAIRAEWCVRVSSIDDGIDGVDDNRFDNRFDNRGDGGDGGDGGKEEGGY